MNTAPAWRRARSFTSDSLPSPILFGGVSWNSTEVERTVAGIRISPAAFVVLGELDVVALAVHPDDDVTDAAPGVEPAVKQAQLGLHRRHEREPDGGAEEAGAGVQFLWSDHSMIWSARAISDRGIVRPMARATAPLIRNSYFLGS